MAYDASVKANVRLQFVATEVVPGKAPVRKVYEPRACSGAIGKEMAVRDWGRYIVEQSKLLCSSELDAAVLFGERRDGGRVELALEATLCPEPAQGDS